jgi:hypothetical protein
MMNNTAINIRPNYSAQDLRPPTGILEIFDGHGAYCCAWGACYFLCAADLNRCLEAGTTWEDPEAQRRAVILLVAEIEVESSTAAGSFRFTDVDEYAQHRSRLTHNIRTCRAFLKAHASSSKLREKVAALSSARG